MRAKHGKSTAVAVVAAAALLGAAPAVAAPVRPADPVVVKGRALPALIGVAPGEIVAFRYKHGWRQVPVQVDERRKVNLRQVYGGTGDQGVVVGAYADADASAGPDPDPRLDADDEVALMARDTGGRAPAGSRPAGVRAKRALELRVGDPVLGGTRYVYLFVRAPGGGLDPDAGRSYVSYSFRLASGGSYRDSYSIGYGPNPERSTVVAPAYERSFADRWVDDGLSIRAGGASGADILDRHAVRLAGTCFRTEDTFSSGEGAFLANVSGPVRGIRSFIGANSGPNTQRDHVFYGAREDIRTYLRVHAIPGPMDLFDYAPAALGMTHRSNVDPDGVTIDGTPDAQPSGELRWELVSGAQGALTMSGWMTTTIRGTSLQAFYEDSQQQGQTCTGDGRAYGLSGGQITGNMPNTDPGSPGYESLTATRVIHYREPATTVAEAKRDDAFARMPLKVRVAKRQ